MNFKGVDISSHESTVNSPSSRTEGRADLDPVGDVNKYTSGMEFYGTSSNVALLSQLISHARSRVSDPPDECGNGPNSHSGTESFSALNVGGRIPSSSSRPSVVGTNNEKRKILEESRVSIVELLFDEHSEALNSGPGSRPTTPNGSGHKDSTQKSLRDMEINPVENLLEREYMNVFFNNLYYIHPILSRADFTARCEREIWSKGALHVLPGRQMHFWALYKTIVAVGSLTAGTDLFENLRRQTRLIKSHRHSANRQKKLVPTSIDLSRVYFRQARRLLGDVFEVCSLESAQALILMVRVPDLLIFLVVQANDSLGSLSIAKMLSSPMLVLCTVAWL